MNNIVAVLSILAGLAGIWQIANLAGRSGIEKNVIFTLSLSNFVLAFLAIDISDIIKLSLAFSVISANAICSWKTYKVKMT